MRTTITTGAGILACTTLLLCAATAPAAERGVEAALQAGDAGALLEALHHQSVNDELHLTHSTLVDLALEEEPEYPVIVQLDLDGIPYTLELRQHSVRGDGYQLYEQIADGSLVAVPSGPVSTVRGDALESPGSTVAGSLYQGELQLMIRIPEVEGRYWIQPAPNGPAGEHVIYHDLDVLGPGGVCGVGVFEDLPEAPDEIIDAPDGAGGVAGAGECYWFAQLAADADWEYYLDYGQNSATVESQINSIINVMNSQYQDDVQISHQVVAIVVRTTSADPYSGTSSPAGLLNEFRNWWNNNHGNIARDVAHLFTGRSLADPVIGIAFTQNICTSSAYSLVENIGNFNCRTDLSAHELGHNWSAEHCNCPSHTMNSSLTCANQFNATFTVPDIVAYRIARQFCLINECIPSNDDCDDAIPIGNGSLAFNTNFATTDGLGDNLCNAGGSNQIEKDVWFRYDADCSGTVTVSLCSSGFDTRVAVYQTFCPMTVNQAIACNDNACGSGGTRSTLTFEATAGLSYLFRAGGTNGADGAGIITVSGPSCLPPPANDNCGSAMGIGDGVHPYHNAGATTDGPSDSLCGGQIQNDVWYRWIATCTGTAMVDLCNSSYDTTCAIYGTSCPGGTPDTALACNEDACGLQSTVTWQVTQGTIYRIRIGSSTGEFGSGQLAISCGATIDCNDNGIDDALDIGAGTSLDCNGNEVPDECDITGGTSADCNENATPDECEIAGGSAQDCNGNGVLDECDISGGTSDDDNTNGIPDECEAVECPTDIDGNGQTDVDDLVAIIVAWGTSDPDADIDGSGTVDVDDLVALIVAWGPCEQK